MSVHNVLNAALYSTLSGGTALTALLAGTTSVYFEQAPDDAALPYVVWNYQGGGDDNKSPHRTKQIVAFVRGYNQTGPALAGSIDAQIDALLHRQALTVSGWANYWTAREQDLSAVETDAANVKTWMSGGYYRVRLEDV